MDRLCFAACRSSKERGCVNGVWPRSCPLATNQPNTALNRSYRWRLRDGEPVITESVWHKIDLKVKEKARSRKGKILLESSKCIFCETVLGTGKMDAVGNRLMKPGSDAGKHGRIKTIRWPAG